ncbi:hypothetical protein FOZ62_029395 [Perkinsus olseni]|uniref:Uncharacterized protein n=1 Tax=Perkinsus olseni TaxID=32597 RepID=A0A7J6S3M2_PEROL|nr:hypothetical protein FOZ62_029395 [Perkinsus olseni]
MATYHQYHDYRYKCRPGRLSHLERARTLSSTSRFYPASLKRDTNGDLAGHAGCVNTLWWSEDGELLLSGSDDTRLMLWKYSDISRGDGEGRCRPAETIETGHRSNIFHARFFPDRSFLVASCSLDTTVKVIDIENGIVLETCNTHKDMVSKLVIPWDCPQLVISCSADSTIRQFDIRAGPSSSQVLSRWAHWRSGINAISGGWAMRPYSVLAGGDWPVVQLYDRRRMVADRASDSGPGPEPVASFRGPSLGDNRSERLNVSGVCLSHTGRIAIGSWMNGEGIYAFDVDSPNEPLGPPFKGHANFRTVKEVSLVGLNQEYVASGSDDGNWFAWRLQQGPRSVLQEDFGGTSSSDWSYDDENNSSSNNNNHDDEPLSRYHVDPRLSFIGFGGDHEVVNCVQQHPSDLCVATSGIDEDVKLWRPGRTQKRTTQRSLRQACRANEAPANLGRYLDFPVMTMMRLLDERVRNGTIHDDNDDDIEGDEEELLARRQLRALLASVARRRDSDEDIQSAPSAGDEPESGLCVSFITPSYLLSMMTVFPSLQLVDELGFCTGVLGDGFRFNLFNRSLPGLVRLNANRST